MSTREPGSAPDPAAPVTGGRATDFWEAAAARMASAPDPALIARLANEFFGAGPWTTAAPVALAQPAPAAGPALAVPGTAPAGAFDPPVLVASTAAPGRPPESPLGVQAPAVPVVPRSPVAVPTEDDLRSLPFTIGGVHSILPLVPERAPAIPGELFYFVDEARAGTAKGDSSPVRSERPGLGADVLGFQHERVPDLGFAARPFDPRAVRRDFPILNEQVHGRRLVWLDNAATTQKPRAVIDRLSSFYEHENSNIHRAAHTLAARATDAYEASREKVRRFLGASSPREIVFVRGTTEGINLVAQAWGRRNVGAGDEIVVTWLEHHANIVPWQQLCSEKGARLRVAPVDDSGQVILEEYEKLLGPRTRLVSLTQVSNALGTITPARDMVSMAHRHGARALVDGAQSVSHLRVNVQELGCDFFVFSGHKVFGPTGIGAVYGRPEVLEAMPPWQGGGNMIADVTFERTVYQEPPARFEAGTGNIADAVGLGAALDYVDSVGLEAITHYEHGLLAYATQGLRSVPGLKLIGTAREKAGVLSFVLDGVRSEDVGTALDREGIAVRAGHHCAQPILRRFGLESTVRASLALYNSCEDVDALVAALLRMQADRKHLAG